MKDSPLTTNVVTVGSVISGGAMLGTAVAGPIGAVVGAVVGAAAGVAAISDHKSRIDRNSASGDMNTDKDGVTAGH